MGVIVGALAHGTVSPLVKGAAMDLWIRNENTVYDAEKRIGQLNSLSRPYRLSRPEG
jgi:hypothetical protein